MKTNCTKFWSRLIMHDDMWCDQILMTDNNQHETIIIWHALNIPKHNDMELITWHRWHSMAWQLRGIDDDMAYDIARWHSKHWWCGILTWQALMMWHDVEKWHGKQWCMNDATKSIWDEHYIFGDFFY